MLMGVIKQLKDHSLVVGETNNVNGKGNNKGKEKKHSEQKKKDNPKPSEGTSNYKRGKQNQKEKTKCPYCKKMFSSWEFLYE